MGSHSVDRFRPQDYLAPRYWPTWVGLGLLRLIILLPDPALRTLARGLGHLGYHLMPQRRRITRTNIDRVFPELDKAARRRLVHDSFAAATYAVFESAIAWWAPDRRLQNRYTLEGRDHLDAALARGKGVILLGGHYTTLEISGRLLGYEVPNVYPTYKQAHNPLVEALMSRARRRNNAGLIESSDFRGIIRRLKHNDVIWFAPDQDFGADRCVFAPFMGIPAVTLTATARLARLSGAPVLPYYSRRLPDGRYALRIGPPLQDFPSGDDVRDATAVNRAIEIGVREAPGQYLWGHRRFRTRPRGEPQFYRARRDRNLRRYSRALLLVSLPAIGYTLWQAWRQRDPAYLRERLGFGPWPGGPFDHWFHAASVGEVNAVAPLIERLRERWPDARVLLTVNTPSGRRTAERRFGEAIAIGYLPIDWLFAVRRFLNRIRPRNSLVVETELWPNLYLEAHYRGAPVSLVNARLSSRSIRAPVWVQRILGRTLESVHTILARSAEDAERYRQFAFPAEHLEVVGNLKFAQPETASATPFETDRPYVLAASTRPGEERRLATLWRRLAPEALLIIVPRHPKRLKAILADLADSGLPVAVRSRGEPVTDRTRIYVADTFGELPAFIAGSRFVIMGGSLEPFGGQNILEAARAGKAVIFGPHMDNFADEARLFVERHAGRQVKDDAALEAAVSDLLTHPELAESMGREGRALMDEMAGMADRYLDRLCERLPRFRPAPPSGSRSTDSASPPR